MVEQLKNEFLREAHTTRRVMERIPEDQLAFKPNAKGMALGPLAAHIAAIPAAITGMAKGESFDASSANFNPPMPESKAAVLEALDRSIAAAAEYLSSLTPEDLAANWRLTRGETEVFSMPRGQLLRSIMLNHWYHHRGQLSVYLRCLDVALPSIYGPSADENPFG